MDSWPAFRERGKAAQCCRRGSLPTSVCALVCAAQQDLVEPHLPDRGAGQRDAVRLRSLCRPCPSILFSGRGLDWRNGVFTAFLLFKPVCEEYEASVIFCIGMLVATLMLVLMSLSGFLEK